MTWLRGTATEADVADLRPAQLARLVLKSDTIFSPGRWSLRLTHG